MPKRELTFGYEFEIARNGRDVARVLHDLGATGQPELHYYHCRCETCDYSREDLLFAAQEDCTVSAEFPSMVLTWGSERAERAFKVMEEAAIAGGADLTGNSGMHVHVCKPRKRKVLWSGEDAAEHVIEDGEGSGRGTRRLTKRQRTNWYLSRLFARYQDDLLEIAAGARASVRGYNTPNRVKPNHADLFWNFDLESRFDNSSPVMQRASGGYSYYGRTRYLTDVGWMFNGSYLDLHRHDHTYEFRLWNATKAAWRQRLAVGLSVAMVKAAWAGENVTQRDDRCLEAVIGPFMDDLTWAGLLRQRFFKGGIENA